MAAPKSNQSLDALAEAFSDRDNSSIWLGEEANNLFSVNGPWLYSSLLKIGYKLFLSQVILIPKTVQFVLRQRERIFLRHVFPTPKHVFFICFRRNFELVIFPVRHRRKTGLGSRRRFSGFPREWIGIFGRGFSTRIIGMVRLSNILVAEVIKSGFRIPLES